MKIVAYLRNFTPRACGLAALLALFRLQRVQAGENHVDYRFELYQEDDNRMKVTTHSALFDVSLSPRFKLNGEVVLDTISGATPRGTPAPNQVATWDTSDPSTLGNTNSTSVKLDEIRPDFRESISLGLEATFGRQRYSFGFTDSTESDYKSLGSALNWSMDFNQKNTTLNLGWSHDEDTVKKSRNWLDKHSDEFLVGVNQLLSPKTTVTVNFIYGDSRGFLSDPYRVVFFQNEVPFNAQDFTGEFEQRPDHKQKFIAYVSATQFFTPVNASLEGSYRFYHDTYGVDAHTVSLNWLQKLGKNVVLSPNFRYYRQTAANFYYVQLPDFNTAPDYYSADYRLSEFESYTAGVNLTWNVSKWFTFDAGYKHYVMQGLDGVTSASAYPTANVFTVGCRVWF